MNTSKDGRLSCVCCNTLIKEKESIFCGSCFMDKMWDLEKLDKIKKMVDEIIELAKKDHPKKQQNIYLTRMIQKECKR